MSRRQQPRGEPGRVLHPVLTPTARRRLLLRGIERFNRGEHFAAHEDFEEIWRSTTPEPRDLFQGLVQLAAGLHHALERGRPEPARRVMARGRRRLAPLAPACCGIDVAALLAAVAEWDAWLASPAAAPRPAAPRIAIADPRAVR